MRLRWTRIAVLSCLAASPAFGADPAPGASVVGVGLLPGAPELVIASSGGNDVVQVLEGLTPAAYGGGSTNVANGCVGAGGFADVGSPDAGYAYTSKKHQYDFSFVSGYSVNAFSLLLLDWGDFLPFGTNVDQRYEVSLTAYDALGNSVDVDVAGFTSSGSQVSHRVSNEYGDLAVAGDACQATLGQPGRLPLSVSGPGIVRVQFRFRDAASMDPHVALAAVHYVQQPPPEGVRGEGYWKTHGDWPVSTLVLGSTAHTRDQAVALFGTPPAGDMTYNLVHALIAAKLNVAAGNPSSCIADAIHRADAWLVANPIASKVKASSAAWKNEGAALASLLQQYDDGALCAPAAH